MSSKKCLLVIDLQIGMFALSKPLYKGDSLLAKIKQLINKARTENSRVIYLQHCGSDRSPFKKGTNGWKLHPLINPEPGENVIEKKYSDSFQDTGLKDILLKLGVDQIVVCGLVTEGCVDTTIRQAYSLGYKVELAADCHSTTDSNILKAEQIINHHNQVLKIFSEVKESKNISFED